MVKPPLRTKSIGFKVSEEEYARLETAAQASGRTLGEWCREAILRGGSASDAARHDPALAEIVGVRLLLVNVLRPPWRQARSWPRKRSTKCWTKSAKPSTSSRPSCSSRRPGRNRSQKKPAARGSG